MTLTRRGACGCVLSGLLLALAVAAVSVREGGATVLHETPSAKTAAVGIGRRKEKDAEDRAAQVDQPDVAAVEIADTSSEVASIASREGLVPLKTAIDLREDVIVATLMSTSINVIRPVNQTSNEDLVQQKLLNNLLLDIASSSSELASVAARPAHHAAPDGERRRRLGTDWCNNAKPASGVHTLPAGGPVCNLDTHVVVAQSSSLSLSTGPTAEYPTPGDALAVISGQGKTRIFVVFGELTLADIILEKGKATIGGGIAAESGGSVFLQLAVLRRRAKRHFVHEKFRGLRERRGCASQQRR